MTFRVSFLGGFLRVTITTEQLTVEAGLKPAACIQFIMMIIKNEFIISTLGNENCLIPKQSHVNTYMLNKCIR